MKKFVALILSILLVVPLAACDGNHAENGDSHKTDLSSQTTTAVPSESNDPEMNFPETEGFVDYEDMASASEAVGFEFAPPRRLSGYYYTDFQVHPEREIIQALYIVSGDLIGVIRKGKTAEDISDDETDYGIVEVVDVGDLKVTMKGDNDMMHLALWTDGEYSYSVKHVGGVVKETMAAIVRSID